MAVDNIIASKGVEQFCKNLERLDRDLAIFYEVKANLKPERLADFSRAGITFIQPGIENFSDNVLRLMKKGTTGLANIACLRWAAMLGVHVGWNILFGFPGEQREDIEIHCRLFSSLTHLPPPEAVGRVRIDRFSPNYEDSDLRSQFESVKPLENYQYVYPPSLDLDKAAYFFEGQAKDCPSDTEYSELVSLANEWKDLWGKSDGRRSNALEGGVPPVLVVHGFGSEESAKVVDSRGGECLDYLLTEPETKLYNSMFTSPVGVRQLQARYPNYDVDSLLAGLELKKLVARQGGSVLALAVLPPDEIHKQFAGTKPALYEKFVR